MQDPQLSKSVSAELMKLWETWFFAAYTLHVIWFMTEN